MTTVNGQQSIDMSKFYKIQNADGKCWWMPVRGMRVGLALYQPSGWKGRMLKRWLPWLHWSRLVRAVLGIENGELRIENLMPEELRRAVCEAFGVREFEYSVFGGTPSVHQKTVIQVWNDERILGYVKVTESEEVGRLFFREAEFLRKITDNISLTENNISLTEPSERTEFLSLRDVLSPTDNTDLKDFLPSGFNDSLFLASLKKRSTDDTDFYAEATPAGLLSTCNGLQIAECVPEARAMRVRSEELGVRSDGLWVLVQTTRKSLESVMVREWGEMLEEFLERLYDATAQEMAWEESGVARALCDLREHVDWLPDGVDGEAVAKRIDAVVERMAGKRVKYGAYHGDFTPWNMFVEKGELFVFDWEYAGWGYPKGLDRYHFWMQTAIHEKHWGAEELLRYVGSVDGEWIDGEMLEMYVLDVMSKYVMREGGRVKDVGAFEVWGAVITARVPAGDFVHSRSE